MKAGILIKETDVQASIIQYLNFRGIFAWRNNTIGVWDAKRKRYRTNPHTMKGVSDIIGILENGKFLAIECKSETGTLSREQKDFIDNINRHGGHAICARSVEDVRQFLDVIQSK